MYSFKVFTDLFSLSFSFHCQGKMFSFYVFIYLLFLLLCLETCIHLEYLLIYFFYPLLPLVKSKGSSFYLFTHYLFLLHVYSFIHRSCILYYKESKRAHAFPFTNAFTSLINSTAPATLKNLLRIITQFSPVISSVPVIIIIIISRLATVMNTNEATRAGSKNKGSLLIMHWWKGGRWKVNYEW